MQAQGNQQMHVYKITHRNSGRVYIGATVLKDAQARWEQHVKAARAGRPTSKFHRTMKKHGVDQFEFEVIETAEAYQTLIERENYWIAKFKETETGVYNQMQRRRPNPAIQIQRKGRSRGKRRGTGINGKPVTITHDGWLATVEIDEDAGLFHGNVINTRAVLTFQGKTIAELRQAFADTIADYRDWCTERGVAPGKPYSGTLSLRIDPNLHRRLAVEAAEHDESLNQYLAERMAERSGSPKLRKPLASHGAEISDELRVAEDRHTP